MTPENPSSLLQLSSFLYTVSVPFVISKVLPCRWDLSIAFMCQIVLGSHLECNRHWGTSLPRPWETLGREARLVWWFLIVLACSLFWEGKGSRHCSCESLAVILQVEKKHQNRATTHPIKLACKRYSSRLPVTIKLQLS